MNGRALTAALGGRWHDSYGTARCPVHNDRAMHGGPICTATTEVVP